MDGNNELITTDWTVEWAYQQYSGAIYAKLYHKLGNKEIAEELLQETFLQVLHKKEQLKNPQSLRAWIGKIAENQIKAYFLKKSKEEELLAPEVDKVGRPVFDSISSKEEEIEKQLIRQEQCDLLVEAMKKLSLEEQLLIHLRNYEDKSFSEIAKIMDMNLHTAKTKNVGLLKNAKRYT